MFKNIFKSTMLAILSFILLLVIIYLLFTNFYPTFGGSISKEDQLEYSKSEQYKDGKFHNTKPVPKELSFTETLSLAYKFFTTTVPNGRPEKDIAVEKIDSLQLANYKGDARLIWFGHSSFVLQTEGKTVLIDPMFSKVAAPHPLLGTNRFNTEFPLDIEKLPKIDAVIYSHDHYDHLDYDSVLKIKDKVAHFFVPLGVGVHLKAWGVSKQQITELDWWQDTQLDGIQLVCTPSQHFSGRKMNTGQSTLWSSWVIKSKNGSIFFSGDSGYSDHFKAIGDKYGPFDIALMECGQYNKMWPDIHMMPEETAIAGVDLGAKRIMPIHWGSFKLALHAWTDPISRIKAKAEELSLDLITPKIGQEFYINNDTNVYSNWWESY